MWYLATCKAKYLTIKQAYNNRQTVPNVSTKIVWSINFIIPNQLIKNDNVRREETFGISKIIAN